MDLSSFLSDIVEVESNNHVNVLVKLNNEYSLLFEGSFIIHRKGTLVFCSNDYMDSNFSPEKLEEFGNYLNKQKIESVQVDDGNGRLKIVLGNGLTLETVFEEDDW